MKLENPKYKTIAEGEYSAVIVDLTDLGNVKTLDGVFHKCRLILQVDDPRTECRENPTVRRDFVLSNAPNSRLVQFIQALFDRELSKEERLEFDVESLVGTACKVQIVHNPDKEDPDRVWANIDKVRGYPADLRPMRVTPYVREKDRNGKGKQLVSQPRKTSAEIAAEEKRLADFLNDDDMPTPNPPAAATEASTAVAATEYVGTDPDVPF